MLIQLAVRFFGYAAVLVTLFLEQGCASYNDTEENQTRFELSVVNESIQKYIKDIGHPPSDDCGLNCLVSNLQNEKAWAGPYYSSFKSNPNFVDGSQKEMVYRYQAGNYKLYSVGDNGVDEGGAGDDLLPPDLESQGYSGRKLTFLALVLLFLVAVSVYVFAEARASRNGK